jgi:hypothetical protein
LTILSIRERGGNINGILKWVKISGTTTTLWIQKIAGSIIWQFCESSLFKELWLLKKIVNYLARVPHYRFQ